MSVQNYRRNRRIRVMEVRLIDENGEQIGVVSTKDALERARRANLDLVEVAPTARPPVCKILDWGKFNYEQNKKEKKTTGPKPKSGLKELRVRPAISDHDLSYRLKDGRKFCEEGNKVLVVCIFRGRQMAHPEHGYDVMKRVSETMADVAKVEMPAKLMGKRMTMLMAPLPASQRRAIAKDRERSPDESYDPARSSGPADRPVATRPAAERAAMARQASADSASADADDSEDQVDGAADADSGSEAN
ncbi:MAG: translation initiation factor IF-3 [Planctomycetota bacterium]